MQPIQFNLNSFSCQVCRKQEESLHINRWQHKVSPEKGGCRDKIKFWTPSLWAAKMLKYRYSLNIVLWDFFHWLRQCGRVVCPTAPTCLRVKIMDPMRLLFLPILILLELFRSPPEYKIKIPVWINPIMVGIERGEGVGWSLGRES